MYKTAEEISDGNWSRINPNKEISQAKPGYKIWSDKGFTEIKNVVRCGVKKPVSRILVHTGHVICSNEHSLLRENLESVNYALQYEYTTFGAGGFFGDSAKFKKSNKDTTKHPE